jgi:hypothetical protein
MARHTIELDHIQIAAGVETPFSPALKAYPP